MIKFIPLFFISFSLHAKPCKDLIQKMLEHYPDQDTQKILLRFQNAKDKHKFMRAFIPYYYKEAFDVKEALPVYQKLKAHKGQMIGDAHVENFGFIVSNKGVPKFTFNDYDDVAEAPVFLDVLRHYQSASYMTDSKKKKLIEAYKMGVLGIKRPYSSYIQKLEVKAKKGGFTTKADILETPHGPKFASKDEPNFGLTAKEKTSVEKVFKDKFGTKIKLHDVYRTMKESGGSAFGTRYHALVELNGQIQFIELKQVMEGGVVAWTKKTNDSKRVKSSMQTFLGDDFDQRLDVVNVGKDPYQLRFKSKGNVSIDFAELSEKQMDQVIQDEIYLIGQLHRTSLGGTDKSVSAYVKDFETTTIEEWDKSVEIMKNKMKKAYKDTGK